MTSDRARRRGVAASYTRCMLRLQDRVAIITGGASGMGEGIAIRFAEEGAGLVADVDAVRGEGGRRH